MRPILRVLQSEQLNRAAREELTRLGLSLVRTGVLARLGRRLGLEARSYGDPRKSWLFEAARRGGLSPVGTLEYQAQQPAITFAGRQYTFAWFAMRKAPAA